jgi:hypothetical protein
LRRARLQNFHSRSIKSSLAFLACLVSYFLVAVELPKSPNQSSSNPCNYFSSFFSCFFFGSLSSKLKSLKKLFNDTKLLIVRIFSFFRVLVYIDLDFFALFERKVNLIAEFLLQSVGVQAPKKIFKRLQFVALVVLLKDNSEVKGIIPVSKSHTDPQEATGRLLKSNCVPPRTVLCFNYGLLVVWGYLSLRKNFIGFVNEGHLYDFVFLCDFDATLPKHLFPVIQVVSFRLGKGRHFEYGDSLFFVTVG